jgi:hypothetical protein
MVLKILLPVVQNGLKILREGAFLAQGRINAHHTGNMWPRLA